MDALEGGFETVMSPGLEAAFGGGGGFVGGVSFLRGVELMTVSLAREMGSFLVLKISKIPSLLEAL